MLKQRLRPYKAAVLRYLDRVRFHPRYAAYQARYRRDSRQSAATVEPFAGQIVRSGSLNVDRVIPKLIWMYWDATPPLVVQRCIARIQRLHPDYRVVVLDATSVRSYVEDQWIFASPMSAQMRADLVRLYLLYHHGGIWLDASVMLFEDLAWVHDVAAQQQVGLVGFYRAKNTLYRDHPVIENWFLACSRHNRLIGLWLDEVRVVIEQGAAAYLATIKAGPAPEQLLQQMGDPTYLVAYVACQKIMRQEGLEFAVFDCDRSAFFYQLQRDWCRVNLIENLALSHAPATLPKLIKLRKEDRGVVEKSIERGQVKPGSLLDIFLYEGTQDA